MTQHNDTIRLRHMLDHAQEAVAIVGGKDRADLHCDRVLELALVRLVEIIGEAAARVNLETQDRYPGIPWKEAVGMRNRLVHGYDSVDLDVLWDTLEDDLPSLIAELEQILQDID
jgi:uncharacterized protein with HEPN domain